MKEWRSQFVATGEIIGGRDSQAAAWISPDGLAWEQTMTAGDPGERGRARQLFALQDGLVVVGWVGEEHCPDGGAGAPPCDPLPIVSWTSADGRSWIRHDLGGGFSLARINSVAANATELVAVGRGDDLAPRIWKSRDGVTWAPQSLGDEFAQANLHDVVWTGSTWVVSGSVGPERPQSGGVIEPPDTTGSIWIADGDSWLRADFGDLTWSVSALSAGSAGLVAAAEVPDSLKTATLWSSPDGNEWSPLPAGTPLPVASNGDWVIGQTYAADDWIAYSATSDGRDWHTLTDAGNLQSRPHWQGRPQADGAFLVRDRLLVVSSDGLVWPTRVGSP